MIFIPFLSLDETLQNAAIDFVKRHESFAVQLSAAIIKSKENLFVAFDKPCDSDDSDENIFGVLIFGKSVLHCLPFFKARKQNADSENAFSSALKDFYTEKNIPLPFSVNGEKNGTSAVLAAFSLLGEKPAQKNEYNLLRLNVDEFLKIKPFPLNQGETYIRCGKNLPSPLLESLVELQKNYEIEEVTPSCFQFNEDLSRLKLKNSLRRQCILAVAEKGGKIVSKVQTNAIANRFVQIGGVYTNQNCRRKHYAFNLMILLCRKILKAKKNPVLFVKTENTNAAFLYEKLGFKKTDGYTIAYFSHNE